MTMIISVCTPLHDTECVLVTYDNDNLIQVNGCFYGVGEKAAHLSMHAVARY